MNNIENKEIILESRTKPEDLASECLSYFVRIYQHMLKWKYQPMSQSTHWLASSLGYIVSISNKVYDVKKKKYNINVINLINNGLYEKYLIAVEEAVAETGIDSIRSDITLKYKTKYNYRRAMFYDFNEFSKFIDFNRVINWMCQYASTKGLNYLKENDIVKANYTGDFVHIDLIE